MKIKVKPEDFIVEEVISDIPLKEKGPYQLYLLRKAGMNTIELLRSIAQRYRVPFSTLAYGGRKDKHALTTQYFTAPASASLPSSFEEKRWKMTFVGRIDRPMGPDLIQGNSFVITIRDVTPEDAEKVNPEAIAVRHQGFANYFDDQRFGSYDPKNGFIAEKIIRKHFNGALKIYLTRLSTEDRSAEKKRKQRVFDAWGSWKSCCNHAATAFEREAYEYLTKHPRGFVEILRNVSADEMSLFIAAYQAYIWNDVLKRFLEDIIKHERTSYDGAVGKYIFYRLLSKSDYNYVRTVQIPLPASKVVFPQPKIKAFYDTVLKDKGLALSQFNMKKIRQAYFKGTLRAAIVVPEGFEWQIEPDELYRLKKKVRLTFILPRGSYATMLVKRLFSTPYV